MLLVPRQRMRSRQIHAQDAAHVHMNIIDTVIGVGWQIVGRRVELYYKTSRYDVNWHKSRNKLTQPVGCCLLEYTHDTEQECWRRRAARVGTLNLFFNVAILFWIMCLLTRSLLAFSVHTTYLAIIPSAQPFIDRRPSSINTENGHRCGVIDLLTHISLSLCHWPWHAIQLPTAITSPSPEVPNTPPAPSSGCTEPPHRRTSRSFPNLNPSFFYFF